MSSEAFAIYQPKESLWNKIKRRAFPHKGFPSLPEDSKWAAKGDVIHLEVRTDFSFIDRLKILISGQMTVKAIIITEAQPGVTESHANVFPSVN